MNPQKKGVLRRGCGRPPGGPWRDPGSGLDLGLGESSLAESSLAGSSRGEGQYKPGKPVLFTIRGNPGRPPGRPPKPSKNLGSPGFSWGLLGSPVGLLGSGVSWGSPGDLLGISPFYNQAHLGDPNQATRPYCQPCMIGTRTGKVQAKHYSRQWIGIGHGRKTSKIQVLG